MFREGEILSKKCIRHSCLLLIKASASMANPTKHSTATRTSSIAPIMMVCHLRGSPHFEVTDLLFVFERHSKQPPVISGSFVTDLRNHSSVNGSGNRRSEIPSRKA